MPKPTDIVSDSTANYFRKLLAIAFRHLTTIAVVLGALWLVARPHAEEFVRDTISREKFATERALESIENRQESLEASVYDLKKQLEEQDRAQERVNSDLDFLKALQTEQRQDIKQILRGLDRLQSD